ncbi:hypothetical protein Ciccas_001049 [Cichlidogyrus casuarinus]|uniref:Uncharacterized protein n=1 Tax=Cichlidogyrus casuarinus TaxID=1844966 RepID=A0ABD2QLN0_9PLAT
MNPLLLANLCELPLRPEHFDLSKDEKDEFDTVKASYSNINHEAGNSLLSNQNPSLNPSRINFKKCRQDYEFKLRPVSAKDLAIFNDTINFAKTGIAKISAKNMKLYTQMGTMNVASKLLPT